VYRQSLPPKERTLQSLNYSDYDKTMHVATSPTAGALRIQP
jgi:hypothetical protein